MKWPWTRRSEAWEFLVRLEAENRRLAKENEAMIAERKDTLNLSRRRLDESQAEIARLTEELAIYKVSANADR